MYKRTAQEWESREFHRTYGNTTWTGGIVVRLSVEMEAFVAVVIVRCRGVARGCERCGPHQAALARGGKLAKIEKKTSREISDSKFHTFASAIKTKS